MPTWRYGSRPGFSGRPPRPRSRGGLPLPTTRRRRRRRRHSSVFAGGSHRRWSRRRLRTGLGGDLRPAVGCHGGQRGWPKHRRRRRLRQADRRGQARIACRILILIRISSGGPSRSGRVAEQRRWRRRFDESPCRTDGAVYCPISLLPLRSGTPRGAASGRTPADSCGVKFNGAVMAFRCARAGVPGAS